MERLIGMMLQTVQNYNPPPPNTNNSMPLWTHISDALQQSVYRVLSLFKTKLPGILAVFVALTLFTLIGMGLSLLLRRGLTFVKFDVWLFCGFLVWLFLCFL